MDKVEKQKYVLLFNECKKFKKGFQYIILTGSSYPIKGSEIKKNFLTFHEIINKKFIEKVCKNIEESTLRYEKSFNLVYGYKDFLEDYI